MVLNGIVTHFVPIQMDVEYICVCMHILLVEVLKVVLATHLSLILCLLAGPFDDNQSSCSSMANQRRI